MLRVSTLSLWGIMMIPMLALMLTIHVEPLPLIMQIETRAQAVDVNTEWQGRLIELRRIEQSAAVMILAQDLQAPVHIDNVIPLWGVITGFGMLIMAVIVHTVQIREHSRQDEQRFKSIEATIAANHKDLKDYIRNIINLRD